jgi:cysteine-rich repeat protein
VSTGGVAYAATRDQGIFKTSDGGGSWTAVNTGLGSLGGTTVGVDPTDPLTAYAGTLAGMHKTVDGGASWSLANTGLPLSGAANIIIDATALATAYAVVGGAVYKTTTAGASWANASTGLSLTATSVAIDASSPLILYAGGFGFGPGGQRVNKSIDGGASWSPASTGYMSTGGATIAADPNTAGTVYGCSSDYVHKTSNFAGSWALANSGLTPFFIRAIGVDPQVAGHVFAGSDNLGVWESTNGAASWSASGSGMRHQGVFSISVDGGAPAIVYAGTSGGGVYAQPLIACGNGSVDPGEDCDDGNLTNGDCCSAVCAFEVGACNDGLFCNGADTCSAGVCSGHAGDPCTSGGGCADACNEAADDCFDLAGTPCLDEGNACTDDACDGAGLCAHPANTDPCDDDNPCTNPDACAGGSCTGTPAPAPPGTCRVPTATRKSQLQIGDKTTNTKDTFSWKWTKGAATTAGDFGDPVGADDYALCVYDEFGGTPSLLMSATIPSGGICGTNPCWKGLGNPAGTTGFKYKDTAGAAGGITGILLKPGVAGKAKVTMKGKGTSLVLPGENAHAALPLATPAAARVQLHSGNGECWEASFAAGGVVKNQADKLNLKSE